MNSAASPTLADSTAVARPDAARSGTGAMLGTAVLATITLLAFAGAAQPTPADKLTLLALSVFTALCCWTPLYTWCEAQEGAFSFGLTAVMFIVYGLARHAGPASGPEFHLPFDQDDAITMSYAAMVVVAGALLTIPFWWRSLTGWTRAVWTGVGLIAVLSFGAFEFLKGYYPVGATEVIDPGPLVFLLGQLVEYGALALVCSAVCTHPPTRRLVLRALPVVLLLLWARHQFAGAPAPKEDAE